MEAFAHTPAELFLLAATGGLLLVQAAFYGLLYNRINLRLRRLRRTPPAEPDSLPPLSVIICARNEADRLRQNLPAVLGQDYPDFEVIVIVESDTDGSGDLLTAMSARHPRLYHSFVPPSSRHAHPRSLALALGVKASRHEWLVLTDASCHPQSDRWLRTLARNCSADTGLVLGYSNWSGGKGWLHRRAAYDGLFAGMRALGHALCRHPYLGSGRNLACRKSLLAGQQGVPSRLSLNDKHSALFVNATATGSNTRVEVSPEAVVRAEPPARAKDWREEKMEQACTARLLRGWQRYVNGLETTSRAAFHAGWTGCVALSACHLHAAVAGAAVLCFAVRLCFQARVVNRTARQLGEQRRYVWTLPVFDLLQPLQSLCWKLGGRSRRNSGILRP